MRLRAIVTGGAPLPEPVALALEEQSGAAMNELYGMTEASGVIACPRIGRERPAGSVGLPAPGCEIAIGSPSERAGPGERGPVFVRGPNVFAGYLGGGPSGVDGDRWLATGDLGALDVQGRLTLAGRQKDVIIRGGHNIDPLMIEEAAARFPGVLHAAAVGCPDTYAGEVPVLFVSPRPAVVIDLAALATHMAAEVAEPPARPKRIQVVDPMPLTPFGKVFKPALRARLEAER